MMFISGNHVEQKFHYDTLEQCKKEADESVKLIRKAYKNSKDIDVVGMCNQNK